MPLCQERKSKLFFVLRSIGCVVRGESLLVLEPERLSLSVNVYDEIMSSEFEILVRCWYVNLLGGSFGE